MTSEGFSQISVDLSRKAGNAEDEQNSVSRMKIKPITHTQSSILATVTVVSASDSSRDRRVDP
jgi:hypothetical protein